jgi:nicotinamidase-related amidase
MNSVLLVIDVQNEYFTGLMPVTYPTESLKNILRAMDHAQKKGIPVAVIRHTSLAGNAGTFKKGTVGWVLHEEIKRRPADILVEKNLPGSFTRTDLETWLKSRGISRVTIAGYMTQMCCDTTARQAFHRGYAVDFLSDATGTLSVTNAAGTITAGDLHKAVLITQQMLFSRVLSTDEWIRIVAGEPNLSG